MFNMFGYHFYEMEFHHYAMCVERPIIWDLLILYFKANGIDVNHTIFLYSFSSPFSL